MTTYAIAASAVLVIAVICFFIFRDGEVPPPPPGGENNLKTTEYTHQELEGKSEEQMDDIKDRYENENIICRECDEEKVKIGVFNYSIELNDEHKITKITKTKIIKVEPPKPGPETPDQKKKREAREAKAKADKKIADEKKKADEEAKKAGNPVTVSYTAKKGDVASTLAQYGKQKCGTKVSTSAWSPKIKNDGDIKIGTTYTCTCPSPKKAD
jgi:hypothetical protein